MDTKQLNLIDRDVLICGIAFTGRTETLEDYFKAKVKSLTVIALSSCYLKENLSSCRIYEKGALKKEFKVLALRIKDHKWFRQPLIPLVFLVYFYSICLALWRARKRYDICIGASYSFALWGAILKKVGVVNRLIYYCMDYYIPDKKLDFNTMLVRLLNIVDRFTVRTADYLWDVSLRMAQYRQSIGRIKIGSYKSMLVPLGYTRQTRKFSSLEDFNRWEIGFVGSVTANQGLQLLVEAMPAILKELPQVRATIIGQGPYLAELKETVIVKGMDEYFTFHGFIKEEDKMLEILSKSAVAVALYSETVENKNIICADPGKLKLYAVCGLPIITTKAVSLTKEIVDSNAGKVIEYKKENLVNAVIDILKDDFKLKMFRKNSFDLGKQFFSESIFNEVMNKFVLEVK